MKKKITLLKVAASDLCWSLQFEVDDRGHRPSLNEGFSFSRKGLEQKQEIKQKLSYVYV